MPSDNSSVPAPETDEGPHPWSDPELPAERRIDDLLARLTLEEKIGCLSTDPSVHRLGIKGSGHVEGLHGLALGGPGNWGRDEPIPTTTFPQAIGLAESWDPEVLERVAAIEAHEARYAFQCPSYLRGGLVVRAPNADLGRDPRWGRTEECYGEDPFFNGTMAVAFVRGLHGDHPRYWKAAALLKHFLANSNENERDRSSSDFDERLFREYYSEPFRRAIEEGGARAFMAAYNAYNGTPCHVHPMLREITIGEWHQDGIICTDGGGLRLLVNSHQAYPDLARGAAATIKAGITQYLDDFRDAVRSALEQGLLGEADLDEAIRRTFRVMLKLGLLDPPELVPYGAIGTDGSDEPWHSAEHRAAVREVTRRSVVLLKNDGLLPLDKTKLSSIAVIGPLADRVLIDWYSGTPPYTVSPVEGIKSHVGAGVRVALGSNNDRSDAVRLARESDVCIVCIGNHPTGDAGWAKVARASYGKEAVDRQSLEIEEEALVKRVLAANPRTIVVLITSFPCDVAWSKENVPAIVHITHNSQELGNSLADVLFGDYNPGGRLVQTWPKSIDDLPPMMDYELKNGRTYLYSTKEPLFAFGYGLSYTTFTYANLRTSAASMPADGSITVAVDVTNTGAIAGDEVVQLYVRHESSRIERPLIALKGFRRVAIEPGETRKVELRLEAKELAHWDVGTKAFVVEQGKVEVLIGRSSAQIELATMITVGGF